MTTYTIKIQTILEALAERVEPVSFKEVDALINSMHSEFFSFIYPFYDNNADIKAEFEKQFLLHFFTREIGFETYGAFIIKLQSKLIDIMPYYKQLYKTIGLDYDMFSITKMRRHTEGTDENERNINGNRTGNNTNQSTEESTSSDAFSDTPQGGLSNVANLEYLTEYRNIENGTTINGGSTSQDTNTEKNAYQGGFERDETWEGKEGAETYAEILEKERAAIVNINLKIFDECESLFMGVW